MESLWISLLVFLLYGGGIALAVFFVIGATFAHKGGVRSWLYCLSFLILLAQTGCWHFAIAFGNATGGHGEDEFGLDKWVILAGVVLCVWAFAIEFSWMKFHAKRQRQNRRLDD